MRALAIASGLASSTRTASARSAVTKAGVQLADVFLSYARASASDAERIAAGLRSSGFSVWFDTDLPAHRAYSDVIVEQLDAASAVVVLWSKDAAASQWVRSEANRARETERLVQVRLDDARLPMPFDQIQCAELRAWSGDEAATGWRSVIASVAALTNREPASLAPAVPSPRPVVDRRRALIAGGAVVAALSGIGGWRLLRQPAVSPQAQLLIQKGLDALQNNDALDTSDTGSTLQAIAMLTDATEAAPQSATAWGGLAMAYAVRKRAAVLADRSGLDSRSQSAAKTALDLDPREPRALGALRLIAPVYQNWLAAEKADRDAVGRNSSVPILLFIMSDMLGSVGRWKDAVRFSKRFDRKNFLIPGADRKLIIDLWASGDLSGADKAVDLAIQHWPQHLQIWRTRLAYLMYSGRPAEALMLLNDDAERPAGLTNDVVPVLRATAEALAGHSNAAGAVRTNLDFLKANPSAALRVVHGLAALGAGEEVLSVLQGYYFGQGRWAAVAPPAGDQDRVTSPLFQPPMRNLWNDRRFDGLLDRIGLNTYWRVSHTTPDFRRTA